MKIYFAATSPINPPSASPKLTQSQVFEGLKIKARSPTRFVPAIIHCDVEHEDESGLTRFVTFKPGAGPADGRVKEVVTYGGNIRVDFDMVDNDTKIANIISHGSGESDLYLTFTFNLPNVEEGSAEAKAKVEQIESVGRAAVNNTVTEIRELVQKGEIA